MMLHRRACSVEYEGNGRERGVTFTMQSASVPHSPGRSLPAPRAFRSKPHHGRTQASNAAAATTSSPSIPSTNTLKGLREWSVVNAAVRDGLQMVLLRKGGIEEKGFQIEAGEFLLFPSYFHADPSLLKPGMAERYAQVMQLDPKSAPQLQLDTYVRVTGAWATLDPQVVSAVEELHIGTAAFLENRTKWRRGAALTILELQAWRLKEPVLVQPQPKHFGCFSWVDLELPAATVSLEGATPCIPDFEQRQQRLRERLAQLSHTQQLPLA